jgi:hypothetical protein
MEAMFPSSEDVDILQIRDYLRHLWMEIRLLPWHQRVALLLNMDEIHLFPETGIVSVRDIANTLEMPSEELGALWYDLPLDDLSIAPRIGKDVTRQQVIGYRRKARLRLARRMEALLKSEI